MKTLIAVLLLAIVVFAQQQPAPTDPAQQMRALQRRLESQAQEIDVAQKKADDVLWHLKLSDVADVDKIRVASSKPIRMLNSTGQGAGNPLIIYAYVFTPKKLSGKAPLLIFVHGGVHSSFETTYAHIVRELMEQGYVVVAPEYRGSTGYGSEFFDQIDYGGAEIDDTHAVRDWAIQNLSQIDPQRVGIMGWSHGGYQTLMNIFRWPADYKVAFAGMPVSDLVMRMGYKGQGYRDTMAGSTGGKQAEADPMEYRRRSPVFYVDKLATPLLIHSNTNDEDVNVMEVEHLIAALRAAGKKFEAKIYQNMPGGHSFNRLDTAAARDSRKEIYAFLAQYLKPSK
jgi:dipeptidyl aminopeptidase/acylaminoacyl peptidase